MGTASKRKKSGGVSRHVQSTALAIALALQAHTAAPPVIPQAAGIVEVQREKGMSGTPNFSGDPLVESNTKLIHQAAYGQPGSRTPGEWEEIVRTDPDVATALEFTAQQIRDARVDISPAEADGLDPAMAAAQADFVRWSLLEQLEPGWSEVAQQLVKRSLGIGFALQEKVWGWVRHPKLPGGFGQTIVKLAERLPVSVHTNGWIEKDDELVAIRQQGVKNGRYVTVDLAARDVLLLSWNRTGNNYLGFSAFRPVWYLCKIRQDIARLFGISVARESAGLPVASSQSDKATLSKQQRKSLEKLLRNNVFHESASVVMPKGWKLEWIYSPGANKGHVVELYNALGLLILRQVQGQQIALGTGSTGSRSVGEVHTMVADAFAQGVIASLEGVLNGVGRRPYTGLARSIVEANWGPQPAYPKVSITLKKAKLQPVERSTAIKTYVDAGVITVTDDVENVAREDVGLAPIDPAVRELEKKKKAAMAPPVFAMPGAKPVPPKDEKAHAAEEKTGPTKFGRTGPFVARRPLRTSEQHLDLNRMASFLDAAREDFELGVRPMVVEMLAKALPDIRAAMADGTPDELADLELDTKRLEVFIGDFLVRCKDEGYRQVSAERSRGVAPGTTNPVHFAAGDGKPDDAASVAEAQEHTETVLDAQRKQLTRRMADRLKAELENEAIDVVRTRGEAGEVINRTMQSQLETNAFRNDAGAVLTKAWNMGREEFARERAEQVEEVELSAILDEGTCGFCEDADGQTFEFGSAQHDAMTPPLRLCDGRSRCRCLLIYRFKRASEVDDV